MTDKEKMDQQAEATMAMHDEVKDKFLDVLKNYPDIRVVDLDVILDNLKRGLLTVYSYSPLSAFLEKK